MDPYLEGSEWTSVHTELSSEIARQLAPKLRPKYIVRATRRFVMDIPLVTIEIREVRSRDLLTVIELLSPVNKHGRGYQEYIP